MQKDRREMANSYYIQTYGEFVKKEQKVLDENRFLNKYAKEWNEAVKRLKESGADLSRIRIVSK
jgi:coproporphyrinogen III oxidase-like Fe-S oxidoreductase